MANIAKDMQLNVGEMLQLVFAADDSQRKHATKVIGYLPGKSLLVTTPRIDGKVMMVREGQPVVVRMLSGNSVYAFNTQILATSLKPFAYLHLTYPAEIECIVVRKSLRVTADLETKVTRVTVDDPKGNVVAKGVIVDVSTSGAMLLADTPLGQVGDLLVLTLRVPVAGVQKYLKLSAMIRSLRVNNDGNHLHGVEFQLLEEMDNIFLHGFVYEQLQKQSAE
ncbi:MAG TPA: flagellar brake protein [Gammaproteobacteria bacterium]|jgi:c-di-GMP-binding flagellar brake protein YcgR|nr:flagellar brake protein [Gammaproteobacteria bacterium]